MDEQTYIKMLWDLGYSHEEYSPTLDIGDQVVMDATRRFHEAFPELMNSFVIKHHKRLLDANGEIGPATLDGMLVRSNGCGESDAAIAFPEVQQAGSGSMPIGCYTDGIHEMRFAVDERRMPNALKQIKDYGAAGKMRRWDRIVQRVVFRYAQRGIRLTQIDDHLEPTNFDVTFVNGAGWIGLGQYNQRHCDTYSFCKLDIGYCASQNDEQVAELLCHEIGHVNRLDHTRGGVMGPVIRHGHTFVGFIDSDPSTRVLRAYYGPDPVTVTDEEDPIDTGSGFIFTGELEGDFRGDIAIIDGVIHVRHGEKTASAIIVPSGEEGIYIPRPYIDVA